MGLTLLNDVLHSNSNPGARIDLPKKVWAEDGIKLGIVIDRLAEICADIAYFWLVQVGRNWYVNTIFTELVNEMPKSRWNRQNLRQFKPTVRASRRMAIL